MSKRYSHSTLQKVAEIQFYRCEVCGNRRLKLTTVVIAVEGETGTREYQMCNECVRWCEERVVKS